METQTIVEQPVDYSTWDDEVLASQRRLIIVVLQVLTSQRSGLLRRCRKLHTRRLQEPDEAARLACDAERTAARNNLKQLVARIRDERARLFAIELEQHARGGTPPCIPGPVAASRQSRSPGS